LGVAQVQGFGLIGSRTRFVSARTFVLLRRLVARVIEPIIGARASDMPPPKLRVTTAQMEHMPFHLRTFFRVLSSWVHLALHNTNPNSLVEGPTLVLASVHAKTRRAGYRNSAGR
jgi:hypothetical protein